MFQTINYACDGIITIIITIATVVGIINVVITAYKTIVRYLLYAHHLKLTS